MTSLQRPLVSIVTPVMNRASVLGACLGSVSAQTYSDIEHIVVDGGSTDGTLDVIRSFESRPNFRWISESDSGMYDAINKGLALARGEFLAYLNSDDLYLPWSVDVAVSRLQADDRVDAVYGDLGVLTKGKRGSRFFPQFYPPFDLNFYTHFGTLAQPTVFWRRALTEKIGTFDIRLRLLGDCEYWLRAAAAGGVFEHIEEIMAIQVEHGGTLRATQPQKLGDEFRQLRAAYSTIAGPARWRRWQSIKRRMRWRYHQLHFVLAAQRQTPLRWPRFLKMLRSGGIKVSRSGLFWYQLPAVVRPRRLTLLDSASLETILANVSQRPEELSRDVVQDAIFTNEEERDRQS